MVREQIVELLKDRMGLEVSSIGLSSVERAMRVRMKKCAVDTEDDYLLRLSQSEDELQELIECIVVPETWFFREEQSFHVLANYINNVWLPKHRGEKLRVLCMPCATGEEPYSIAITLMDMYIPSEQFEIVGMDISRQSLDFAAKGMYRSHSFRGGRQEFRSRYFEETREGWQLAEIVRRNVRFVQGNVLDLDSSQVPGSYDVVFCRNMLIYFTVSVQQTVIGKLSRALTPTGLLFVGSAETFLVRDNQFQAVYEASAFAFRKSSAPAVPRIEKSRLTPNANPKKARSVSHPATPKKAPATRAPSSDTSKPDNASTGASQLDRAEQLANQGKLTQAEEICRKYLNENTSASRAYRLLGLVHEGQGNVKSAMECYRKALYLEPKQSDVLTHLALLLKQEGKGAEARRLQERAHRIHSRVDEA